VAQPLEFRLLGPVGVEVDRKPVAVGGPNQQTLLACLVLKANEVVPSHQLVAALWDAPPKSAATMVQMYVSRLRKLFRSNGGPQRAPRIVTQQGGYLLRVDPEAVDLFRFELLVAEGRASLAEGNPRVAAARFREALGLWRGPALAGLVDAPLGAAESLRLEELRLAALEDRIEADLALGRHAELVPELERLGAEQPFRERLHGQLMLALYRSGRQADALDVFQQTRRALVEDLGLEPGPDLQQLQKAILAHDPALEPPLSGARLDRLPTPSTSLIGRAYELDSVCALLRRDDVRLLTLVGVGGVGKTRLAREAAAKVAPEFTDGAAMVELDSIADPLLVPSAVARALKLSDTEGESIEAALARQLHDRSMLIVLDSLEHLLPAAEFLGELLSETRDLKLLVTSRAALRIAGEHEFPLPPLAVAASDERDHERLVDIPSIGLFVERARAVLPNLDLGTESLLAVAEICRRLDGVPLSIELAAARSNVLPPQALLARLGRRLDLLTSGRRDAAPRHQTLRATMEWSFRLLSEAEQGMFASLAVFAGGFTLEAAEAVCGAGIDPLEGLNSLVDKSLIVQVGETEPRFAMLDTVREYAQERLEASGEAEASRRRHAQFFLALAEQAESELDGVHQHVWLDRLEADHGNLRAAVDFSLDVQDAETALRLCGALRRFWEVHGHFAQGRRCLDAALAIEAETSPLVRIKAWDADGVLAGEQGDVDGARESFEKSVTLARELGAKDVLARELSNLGTATLSAGFCDRAQELYEEAVALKRESGNLSRLGMTLNNLGCAAYCAGKTNEAVPYLEEAESLARAEGDGYGVATVLLSLAGALIAEGDDERPAALLEESMSVATEIGWRQGIVDCLETAAGLVELRNDPRRAACLLGAADALRDSIGAHRTADQRLRHERTVASVRSDLDPLDFRVHYRRGRALPLEEAIHLATPPEPRSSVRSVSIVR
jgi:predicted ATPase/DNA-binding SARP family transcriptional activator